LDREDIFREINSCYQTHNNKTAEDVQALYAQLDDQEAEYLNKPVLLYAAEHCDHVGIKVLLDAGADPAAQDSNESNALHRMAYEDKRFYAPWADEEEAARLLVEAGTSALRKNSDSVTCVHIAAEYGKLGIIKVLVDAGKKMDIPNKSGETALHLACDRAGRAADSYYTYAKSKYDKALAEETEGMDEYQLDSLKERIVRLKEACDKEWAEVELRFDLIKCLIEAGLDPDQKDNYGKTPKDIAFNCQDVRVAALLAGTYTEGEQSEEDMLAMQTKGMNLMQAAEKRDYSAIEALLKLGADPDEICGEELSSSSFKTLGKAPLAMACYRHDAHIICTLLENGASPSQKDSDGKIAPLYFFIPGADLSNNTFENKVVEKTLKGMIEKGFDVNMEADENGNTLLNIACKYVDSASGYNSNTLPGKMIQQLLRYKADPNIADNDGSTPLMPACKGCSSYMEGVQLSLLEAGADVGARDEKGNTPLMFAAQNSNHAMAKTMAEMLFDFGDPNSDAVNNEGQTALAYASERNNENLVSFLLTKM